MMHVALSYPLTFYNAWHGREDYNSRSLDIWWSNNTFDQSNKFEADKYCLITWYFSSLQNCYFVLNYLRP